MNHPAGNIGKKIWDTVGDYLLIDYPNRDEELNIVSLAVTTHCVLNNVAYIRVHDVADTMSAVNAINNYIKIAK